MIFKLRRTMSRDLFRSAGLHENMKSSLESIAANASVVILSNNPVATRFVTTARFVSNLMHCPHVLSLRQVLSLASVVTKLRARPLGPLHVFTPSPATLLIICLSLPLLCVCVCVCAHARTCMCLSQCVPTGARSTSVSVSFARTTRAHS